MLKYVMSGIAVLMFAIGIFQLFSHKDDASDDLNVRMLMMAENWRHIMRKIRLW